jgi:hypothetical protein
VARTDPSGQVTETAWDDGEPLVGVGVAGPVRVAVGPGQGVAAAARPWGRAGAELEQEVCWSQPGAGDDPVAHGVEHASSDGSLSTTTPPAGAGGGVALQDGDGAWQLPAGTPGDGEGQGAEEEMGPQVSRGPAVVPGGHSVGHAWSTSAPAAAAAGHAVIPGLHVSSPAVVPDGQVDGVLVGPPDGLGKSEDFWSPGGNAVCPESGVCVAGGEVVGPGPGGGMGSVVGDTEAGPPEPGGSPAGEWVPDESTPVEVPPDPSPLVAPLAGDPPPVPGSPAAAPPVEPAPAARPPDAPEPDESAECGALAESVAATESCAPAEWAGASVLVAAAFTPASRGGPARPPATPAPAQRSRTLRKTVGTTPRRDRRMSRSADRWPDTSAPPRVRPATR